MVIQTELGLLRRTHYSVQLHEASGKSATVMGWISAVRGHGNISFVTIRDNKGSIQVVAKAGACPDDVREKRQSLYSRFNFIDEMIMVDSFTEVAEKSCQNKLEDLDSILNHMVHSYRS